MLANLIEKLPFTDEDAKDGFSMTNYNHSCGTPSCIAGWAAWEANNRHSVRNGEVSSLALEHLEISQDIGEELFYPHGYSYNRQSPQKAAAVLRHLAATGEVDWDIS